jgi:hypothetical protein
MDQQRKLSDYGRRKGCCGEKVKRERRMEIWASVEAVEGDGRVRSARRAPW